MLQMHRPASTETRTPSTPQPVEQQDPPPHHVARRRCVSLPMIVAPCLERTKNRKDKTARDTCPRSTDEFATTTIYQHTVHRRHHHEKQAQNLVSRVSSSSSSSSTSKPSKSPSPSNVHASHHHDHAVPTNEEDRNPFPSASGGETTPSHEHLIPFPRSPPHPVTTGSQQDEQHQEGQRPVDQLAASAVSGSLVSCSNENVGGDEGKGGRQKPGQSGTLFLAAYPELSAFHPEAYPEQKRPNTAEHGEHHAIDAQKPAPAPPNNHAPRKRGRIPLFAFARLPPLPPPSPVAAAAVPSKPLVPTSAILQSLSPTRLMPPAKNLKQIPRFVTTTYTMTGVTESSSPAAASAAARSVSSTPSPPASKALKRRELPIPVAMVPVKQESDDADADDAGDSKTHRRTFSFSSTSSLYSTTTKKAKKTDTAAAAMRSTRNRTDRVSGTAAEGEDEGTAVLRSRKSFDRLSRALVAGVAKGMSAFSRNGAGVGGGVEADSSRSGVMREPKEEGKGMEKEMEMGDDEEIGWAAFLQSDEMGHGDDERRVPATLTADRTSLGRRSATTTTTGNQRSSSDVKQTQTIPRRKSRLLMMATTSSSTLGHAFSSRFGGGGAKRVEREDSIKDAEGWTPAAAMSPRRRKFSEASWGDSPMAMLGRDDSMNGEKSTRGTCDVGKGSPKVVGNAATTHLERSGTSPSSRYDHPLRLLKHGLAWGAMKRTTTSTSTSAQARIISRPYPFHHHQLVPSLCETSRLSDQSTTTGTTASHPSSSMSMSYHERVATPTLSVGKKALLIAEDDQGGRETARLETLARLEGRSSNDDVATDHEKALDYKGGWVLGLAFAKQVGAV